MSCIHFKFKSSLEYEKLTFEGLQISLSDFKEAVMKQKKIGVSNDYTLRVVDAQSKKVYSNNDEMLQRNTSVVISRIPLVNAPKIPKTQRKDPSLGQPASLSTGVPGFSSLPTLTAASLPPLTSKLTAEELVKTSDLVGANATEEEKVMAMMSQSAEAYDPSQYVKYSGRRGGMVGGGMPKVKPPPTYTCFRCGQTGHYINHCPTNGDPNFDNFRYKRVMGTPSNQFISVSMNMPGAMLDRHGNLVVKKVDLQAYIDSKTKGKIGNMSVPAEAFKEVAVPPELICSLCKEVVKDAVIIPCCGESFCYECIQVHLCENEFICPMCKATNVSPERLAPNKALRASAKNFKMKVAEKKSEAAARGFTKQTLPPPVILNSIKASSPSPITLTQPISTSSTSLTPPASQVTHTTTATTSTTVPYTVPMPTSTVSMATPTVSVAMPMVSMATATLSMETTTAAVTTTSQSLSQESSSSLTSAHPSSRSRPQESFVKMIDHSVDALGSNRTLNQHILPPIGHALPPVMGVMMGGHGPPVGRAAQDSRMLLNGITAMRSAGSVPVIKTSLTPLMPPHLVSRGLLPAPDLHTAAAFMNPMVSMATTKSSTSMSKNSKLEKMAAELLLSSAIPEKSPSPPPLSLAEFYRQQKLLKLLTKKTNSQSRSRSPGSYSHSSWSGSSNPWSRSRSRSWSYDSRSRSRSPHHSSTKKHSAHRSTAKKHKRHRHGGKEVEKSRDKDRERHRGTRSHHDARDKREEIPKRSMKRHRSQTKSPDRKRIKESVATAVISHTSTATLCEADFEGIGKVSHKHKHKKKSKRRHKHRIREQESVSRDGNLIEHTSKAPVSEGNGTVEELRGAKSSPHSSPNSTQEDFSEIKSSNLLPTQNDLVNNFEPESVNMVVSESLEPDPMSSKEEANEDSEIHKQYISEQISSRSSSTSEVGQTGDHTHSSGSNTEVLEQSAPSLPPEESEMDEPLLLDVHVDESIDELEEELMGISSEKKEFQAKDTDKEDSEETAKEEGEISDSVDDDHTDPRILQPTTSPLKQATRLVSNHLQPPEQEDLREEIKRSRQKLNAKQNAALFCVPILSPDLPAVVPPLTPPAIKPMIPLAISKHKKGTVGSELDSEDDLSSEVSDQLEVKVVKKKKYKVSRDHSEHSKHRHSHEAERSRTRERERRRDREENKRADRGKEKREDRVKMKKTVKDKSREQTKSKKTSRDKKESKRPKDKSREKERKAKKKKVKKSISMSQRLD